MTSNVNDPTMISNVNDPAMASIVNDLTHKIGSSEFRETKKMIAIEQKSTEQMRHAFDIRDKHTNP